MWLLIASALAAAPVDLRVPLGGGGVVQIELSCGSLDVAGTSEGDVHITGAVPVEHFDVVPAGDRLVLDATVDSPNECATLSIRVPQGAVVEVDAGAANVAIASVRGPVEVQTLSGSVSVTGARRGVAIETISGDVGVVGPSDRVEVETVSGGCQILSVGPSVSAESVSGAIVVVAGTALERLEVSTVSGPVRVEGPIDGAGRLEIESHSGPVTVRLPPDADAGVTLETFSGHIRNGFGAEGTSAHEASQITLRGGRASVEVSTFSGDISLEPAVMAPVPPPPPLPPDGAGSPPSPPPPPPVIVVDPGKAPKPPKSPK